MIMNKTENIMLQGQTVDCVDNFCYLGHTGSTVFQELRYSRILRALDTVENKKKKHLEAHGPTETKALSHDMRRRKN